MAVDRPIAAQARLTNELWTEQDIVSTNLPTSGFATHALLTSGEALLVIPMTPPKARAASLLRWTDSMSTRDIASRWGAWFGLRTGLATPMLRNRVGIRTTGTDAADPTLHEYLAQVFAVPSVAVAGAWGPTRPNQKPVLRVFDPHGTTLGFAKVGWNRLTKELVNTEASFLATKPKLQTMQVPSLIHRGVWRKRTIAIAEPLLGRTPFRNPEPPEANVLAELASLSDRFEQTLVASSYRATIPKRFPAGATPDVNDAIAAIDNRWGNTEIAWGHWHGDWTPWNMRHNGDRIIVWDWERTAPRVPVGFDAIHYRFHAAVANKRPATQALVEAVGAATPTMLQLGVSEGAIAAVGALYALEMETRFAAHPGESLAEVAWLPGLLSEAIRHFAGS